MREIRKEATVIAFAIAATGIDRVTHAPREMLSPVVGALEVDPRRIMKIAMPKVVRTSLVAVAATAALLAGSAQAANASVATYCTAYGFTTCKTETIPASSGHWIHYDVAPCGWGNIFDADTHKRVGGANVTAGGYVNGLVGRYYMIVRSVSASCAGSINN